MWDLIEPARTGGFGTEGGSARPPWADVPGPAALLDAPLPLEARRGTPDDAPDEDAEVGFEDLGANDPDSEFDDVDDLEEDDEDDDEEDDEEDDLDDEDEDLEDDLDDDEDLDDEALDDAPDDDA